MLRLTTTDGSVYTLDDLGYVIARSDGPREWEYSREWRILGVVTRPNGRRVITLPAILRGAQPGQGWIVDHDHGTFRVWRGAPGRLRKLTTG